MRNYEVHMTCKSLEDMIREDDSIPMGAEVILRFAEVDDTEAMERAFEIINTGEFDSVDVVKVIDLGERAG